MIHDTAFHNTARRWGIAAVGGVGLAAVAALISPAATAHAHGYSTPSGDAVGRPGLQNPAPGVRLAQALGDNVFNQNTPFNKSLDDSPLGQNYHATFGTPDYGTPTHGSNGTWKGILNMDGPIKDGYEAVQGSGRTTMLPDEEDLPGTFVRLVSGAPAAAPHKTDPTPSDSGHSAASSEPSHCTVLTARTTLQAQGSC